MYIVHCTVQVSSGIFYLLYCTVVQCAKQYLKAGTFPWDIRQGEPPPEAKKYVQKRHTRTYLMDCSQWIHLPCGCGMHCTYCKRMQVVECTIVHGEIYLMQCTQWKKLSGLYQWIVLVECTQWNVPSGMYLVDCTSGMYLVECTYSGMYLVECTKWNVPLAGCNYLEMQNLPFRCSRSFLMECVYSGI